MELMEIVRPECVAASRAPKDKAEALQEVVRLAKASPLLKEVSEEDVLRGLREREEIGSTGFGKGIAIPHCRLDSVEGFTVGIVGIPDGVAFDSVDGEPVRLAVFMVGPTTRSSEHIRLLAVISRVLSSPGAVGEMVAAATAEALRESFLRRAVDAPLPDEEDGRSLFHVFVQDETLFADVLQVLGGTEPRFTVVLEAENASAYLWKEPLFAGLWSDNPRSFSRIIVSLVRKRMTNEIVRRIEQVAGPLEKSDKIMVTVQDVFYSAGSLTT